MAEGQYTWGQKYLEPKGLTSEKAEAQQQRYAAQKAAAERAHSGNTESPGFITEDYSGRKFVGEKLSGEAKSEVLGWLGYGDKSKLSPNEKSYVDLMERSGVLNTDFRKAVKQYAYGQDPELLNLLARELPVFQDTLQNELQKVNEKTRDGGFTPEHQAAMTEKAVVRALNSSWRFYAGSRESLLSDVKRAPDRKAFEAAKRKQAQLFARPQNVPALGAVMDPDAWESYVARFRDRSGKIGSDPRFNSHLSMLADFRIRVLEKAFGEKAVAFLISKQEGTGMELEELGLSVDFSPTKENKQMSVEPSKSEIKKLDLERLPLFRGSFTRKQLAENFNLSEEEVSERLNDAFAEESVPMVVGQYLELSRDNPYKTVVKNQIGAAYNKIVVDKLKEKQQEIATKMTAKYSSLRNIFQSLGSGGIDQVQMVERLIRQFATAQPKQFKTIKDSGSGLSGNKEIIRIISQTFAKELENNQVSKSEIETAAKEFSSALAGKITINGVPVRAIDAIDAFTLPFTPEELLNKAMLAGYSIVSRHPTLFQRMGRSYTDSYEDNQERLKNGRMLMRYSGAASLYILKAIADNFGRMTPNGFQSTFDLDSIHDHAVGWAHDTMPGQSKTNMETYFGVQD